MLLPTYLQVEPVGQCNLRCQMCPIQFRRDGPPHGPPAFMPLQTFTRLIDQFDRLEHLHLQGLGEPMMHPQFAEMVAYAAGRGVRVTTNSNMTLLNARRAEACVAAGLDCIHVSIDGASAATYERIRLRGRFDRVLRNIELVRQAKAKLGSARPSLRMVSVLMRSNLSEMPELVRLASRLEMESMFVQHLCHDFGESTLPAEYRPMRQFVEAETLLNEDLERVEHYFGAARAAADELGLELRLPSVRRRLHPPGTPGRSRCDWPWQGAYVAYDGRAMPCCMIATPDRLNFGNMGRSGAEAVWNNGEFAAFREQLDSDQPPDICRSCSIYSGTF